MTITEYKGIGIIHSHDTRFYSRVYFKGVKPDGYKTLSAAKAAISKFLKTECLE